MKEIMAHEEGGLLVRSGYDPARYPQHKPSPSTALPGFTE
jgi:hypothetical protein